MSTMATDTSAGAADEHPAATHGDGAADQGLVELRALIDRASEQAIADRLAVFDEVNARLASELATLDEL